MDKNHYSELFSDIFATKQNEGGAAYLINREANLELVSRLGINHRDVRLNSKESYVSDRSARLLEKKLKVARGWLDAEHEIISQTQLLTIRANNVSALIVSPGFTKQSKHFLSKIVSSSPMSGYQFLFDEITFEEQSYYLRKMEEFLEIERACLDDEAFMEGLY
ncbi:TPA: hypothetical protein ACN33D_003796 [Vibrio parahaemolyticus]